MFSVQHLGSGVQGLGVGVQGVGFRLQGLLLRVHGVGFSIEGLGFGVSSLGFRVMGVGRRQPHPIHDGRACTQEMCWENIVLERTDRDERTRQRSQGSMSLPARCTTRGLLGRDFDRNVTNLALQKAIKSIA